MAYASVDTRVSCSIDLCMDLDQMKFQKYCFKLKLLVLCSLISLRNTNPLSAKCVSHFLLIRMMLLVALKDFFWLLFIPKTREYISADYQVK